MSSEDRHAHLTERDWGHEWDRLPEAPAQFRRSAEPTQLTLRVPDLTVQSLRHEAQRRHLAYHALARSWIVEALDARIAPSHEAVEIDLSLNSDVQLNLKLDADLLLRLKQAAARQRLPYHRLARLYIHDALRLSSARLQAPKGPSLKELTLLLLHARGPQGVPDEAIAGVTRLEKLLFITSRYVPGPAGGTFFAHHYGPFSPDVYESEEELEVEGLIEGATQAAPERASFSRMRALIEKQGTTQEVMKLFRLTGQGRAVAEELLKRGEAYEQAAEFAEQVKKEYGKLSEADLIDRVYREFPEFTGRSKIAHEVEARSKRKAP